MVRCPTLATVFGLIPWHFESALQARLPMLDRLTDRFNLRGAAMKNLAPDASLPSNEGIAGHQALKSNIE